MTARCGRLRALARPFDEPREFHQRLPEYGMTPLHRADGLAATLGVAEVLVKDESSRLGLPAFKMLGASWATYRLLETRRGRPFDEWATLDDLQPQVRELGPLVLATATDGNHGRAVARMARLLGLSARIRVPANTAQARIDAIASEGAEVTVSAGSYDDAVAQVATWATDTTLVVSDTSWDGYREVPEWIIDGYSTIFTEISEQLKSISGGPPSVIFVPVGVGALAAAVIDWLRRPDTTDAAMAVVEPTEAACMLASARAGHIVTITGEQRSVMAGLNCGTPSAAAWARVSTGADLFVTVHDDEAMQAVGLLADAGIVAGEAGAAALAGAVRARDAGLLDRSDRVLLLSTEGATDNQIVAR